MESFENGVYLNYASDCSTDKGLVRDQNQDSVLAITLKRHLAGTPGSVVLMAVADGVGGGPAGDVASRITLSTFSKKLVEYLLEMRSDRHENAIEEAFQNAHREVNQYSMRNPDTLGMASTLTATLIAQSRCYVGHVGDSACYFVRNRSIRKLTIDDVSADGLLRQAVGVMSSISVFKTQIPLEPEDHILLCSDGLTRHLDDGRISQIISQNSPSNDVSKACSSLIQEANSRGGNDNISVAICKIGRSAGIRKVAY